MAKRIETIPLLPHEEYSMGGTAGFQKIWICHCVVPEELHPVLVMSAAIGSEGKTSVTITYLACQAGARNPCFLARRVFESCISGVVIQPNHWLVAPVLAFLACHSVKPRCICGTVKQAFIERVGSRSAFWRGLGSNQQIPASMLGLAPNLPANR